MQTERIASILPPAATVGGLGVCDALRLELQPVQVPWLVDQLEHIRLPLEEELKRMLDAAHSDTDEALEAELIERRYELQLHDIMRAQLEEIARDGPIAFVGPTGIVGELARETMRHVVHSLSELVHSTSQPDGETASLLRETAAAARAWVETFLECQAVEMHCFDPHAEPTRPR